MKTLKEKETIRVDIFQYEESANLKVVAENVKRIIKNDAAERFGNSCLFTVVCLFDNGHADHVDAHTADYRYSIFRIPADGENGEVEILLTTYEMTEE